MRNVYKALGIVLLLLTAQQGAFVHEISHLSGAHQAHERADEVAADQAHCALCAVFAQVVTPAFSHSLQIPLLLHMGSQLAPETRFVAVDASVPRARSRGPPCLT